MCEIQECSFLILAGGKSSRMGKNKAELSIGDETFLEHMIKKGLSMGFPEILVSGGKEQPAEKKLLEKVKIVPDVLKDRGPLGGLYASFLEAENPACFAVSVDVPLISPKTIQSLVKAHKRNRGEATLLCHGEEIEPLIGVYNTRNTEALYELIREKPASVFSYLRKTGYHTVELTEPLDSISNINTPEEYARLKLRCFLDV